MNDPFKAALAFTLKWEGDLVDHPDDPGGLTNFGISQRAYPDEDIRGISRKRVEQIYRDDYWDQILGDQLPPEVAFVVFDYAVNSGVIRAVSALQRAAHAPADGVMGPVTLHALSFYAVPHLVEQVLQDRGRHFLRLGRHPKYASFLAGWMARLISCATKWSIQ
jgi:lysozyme family protein